MARLSKETLPSVQIDDRAPVVQVKKTWLDLLPHGCELSELFQTGKPLDDCLNLVGQTKTSLDKQCKALCSTTCTKCHKAWSEASGTLILQRQIAKAASGDSQMLQWTGKAILRQTEPIDETEEVVPSQINILGLNVNQEQEIVALKQEIKRLKKLVAIPIEGGSNE